MGLMVRIRRCANVSIARVCFKNSDDKGVLDCWNQRVFQG